MDRDRFASFAEILTATLGDEIAELGARAARLSDAVRALDAARLKAQAALDDSQAARATRERLAARSVEPAPSRMTPGAPWTG
jgi:hypothetical protein